MLTVSLAVAQARGAAVRYGTLQVSNTLLGLLFTLGLVVGLGWRWEGRALGHAAAALLVSGSGLALLRREGVISVWPRPSEIFEALRFGLPLVPHALAAVALTTIDRLMVSGLAGESQAGVYFAGAQLMAPLALLGAAINQALVPWLFLCLADPAAVQGDRAGSEGHVRILCFDGYACRYRDRRRPRAAHLVPQVTGSPRRSRLIPLPGDCRAIQWPVLFRDALSLLLQANRVALRSRP